MSRQYFMDTLVDPPLAPGAAITSTSETQLWTVPHFTPIAANDPRPGKIYKVTAGGLITFNNNTAAVTITPRIGTTVAGGTTLGASLAIATNTAITTSPWYLEFVVVWRSVGDAGTNSGCIGHGFWVCNTSTVVNSGLHQTFGGTLATADVSIAQGISIGATQVAGTMTTSFAYIQSLN